MATQFTKDIFASTYKDDFRDSDNYHRILFNSGRSLQARELTQMQTITQRELSRLLKHMFNDGAPINPGGLTVDNAYEYVKLDTTVNLFPTSATDLANLIGTSLTSTEGIVVKVQEAVAAVDSDPATLYVKYMSTQSGTAGSDPIRVKPGTLLTGGGFTFTVQTTNTTGENPNLAVGQGTRVSVHSGDFFAKDRIVFAGEQSMIVSKYSTTPNAVVGFKVEESIVTVADDPNLYDNQGATLNRSAPGADRYRIRLNLALQSELNQSENFIYVGLIREGVLVSAAKAGDDYNTIDDVLARRTQEESGDYIATPFTLKFDTNTADPTLVDLDISQGVAYVDGYRAAPKAKPFISVSKPRTTQLIEDEAIGITYGNFFVINSSTNKGLPNQFDLVTIKDGSNYTGTSIGTAYIGAVEENNDGNVRIHLFNITLNSGVNIRTAGSIGTSVTDYVNIVPIGGKAVLNEAGARTYLYPLPIARPQSVSSADITLLRRFTATVDANDQITLSGLDASPTAGETFTNLTDWLVTETAGAVVTDWTVYSGGAGQTSCTLTVNSLAEGDSVEVYTYIRKQNAQARTKTLTTTTVTTTVSSGVLNLGKADIFDILAIKDGSSTGADISGRFDLDNGQRDSHYALGTLKLKAGQTAPAGNVYVQFRYFIHGTSGYYFAAQSYEGSIDYSSIQNFAAANGETYNLRDCIDFRSVVNSSGNFGSGAIVNLLPRNTSVVEANVNYYLAKNLRVIIDTAGKIHALEGEPALNPSLPAAPTNTLDLFHVRMNPYMIDDQDVNTKLIKAKRYTMKDIDLLEQRLSRLEEVTSLSLLETATENLLVLDSAGNSRFKSGFFVDNFADHSRAGTGAPDYRASIDPIQKIMRPSFISQNVRLIADTSNSSNIVIKGDTAMLPYTHETYINQTLASEYLNVNAFEVVRKTGIMQLSPQTDDWYEIEYRPDAVTDGGDRFVNSPGFAWNDWLWNWSGVPGSVGVGTAFTKQVASNTNLYGNVYGNIYETVTIAGSNVIKENVQDRLLTVTAIPFMRSRRVYFRAWGMKPYQRVFPFFDNVDVSNWVKSEPWSPYSGSEAHYGNRYANAVAHPFTPTAQLYTDGEGYISGSFFIPSTSTMRFRCGTKQFRLIDIDNIDEANATNWATADYTARGVLNTRQVSYTSVRELRVVGTRTSVETYRVEGDPLAQTFYVAEPEGIFVTKVGLRFATKDSQLPVSVQIRPTVNGFPSSDVILAHKQLSASSVLLPTASLGNETINDLQVTYFEFDEPVYLLGNQTYCAVVMADTLEYNVYAAKAGDFLLNSTERRITKQPLSGSLFMSQTSVTWSADQTRDLALTIVKANFDTSVTGTLRLVNAELPQYSLPPNRVLTTDSSDLVSIVYPSHSLTVGDTVNVSGAEALGGIKASSINGARLITKIDPFGIQIQADSAATATAYGGGSNILVDRQIMMDIALPMVESIIPSGTFINYTGKFTSGRSFVSGTAYQQDGSFQPIEPGANLEFATPKLIATSTNELASISLGGDKSAQINCLLTTTTANVSPLIDLQRVSITGINNMIDRQQSLDSDLSGYNKPIVYVSETEPSGGTSASKHITIPVTLAQDAVGIKVMMAVNRPAGSEIDFYYRTNRSDLDADGNLNDSRWTKVSTSNNPGIDNNPAIFREYEYLIGGDNGELTPFEQYQFKIVMKSTNSSKVPTIRDFRAIALGT